MVKFTEVKSPTRLSGKISTLISKHSRQCRDPCPLCPAIAEVNQEHCARAKQIKAELKKNQKLQSTLKHLQRKIRAIDAGLAFIDTANKDLRTALSCDMFPVDKLDQLQTLIDHTETIVNEAKLISSDSKISGPTNSLLKQN